MPLLLFALNANAASTRLSDHIPSKAVDQAALVGHLDSDTHVQTTFILPLRNQDKLQELINRIYDPADKEHYGKYLTPAEFNERFAPTQEDYDTVIAHAKSLGLTIQGTHSNRTLLNVSGPTHAIESAFNLKLHQYVLPSGRSFYAPNDNPEVPHHIASLVSGIVGLDNHSKQRPYHRCKEAHAHAHSATAFPSGPRGGFAPGDLIKAYNLTNVTTNGANQIIALFELASYQASDINTYTQYFGLPPAKLKNILVDGGSNAGINAEVTLDIQLALALAPQSEIYVYEGPNSNQGVLDTYNRIATDNLARQVSTSWGSGEDMASVQYLQAESAIFQQMAAQGQTIYAAAGDSGAYDDYPSNSSRSLIVDDPASQPYVVSVGGTRLTVDAATGDYKSESVWNDGLGNGAGGGGVSRVWAIPTWQANVSTAFSKTHRNVPDVTLNADSETGYAIYHDGQWQIYGGTSCAAPLWAAFTACINQELAAIRAPALGFANPKFYAIGSGSHYTTNFHDVLVGNNLYYSAGAGYDNASGWGSFNGTNLYASLTQTAPPPPVAASFNMLLKHSTPFARGQMGTYKVVVSNTGSSPASGPVSVTLNLPSGLQLRSYSGSGWTFNQSTYSFIQNGALPPGASYPTLLLNVRVSQNAPAAAVSTATLSVGGSAVQTATDPTTIR